MNNGLKTLAFLVFCVITSFSQSYLYAQITSEKSILKPKSFALETAFESNDWAALKNILNQVKPQNIAVCDLDSPYRLLYGHVALATGENSLAVEHFYCDSDSNNSATLNDWHTWTKALAERRPNLASAHYFYGDALARMGNLAKAKEEFDKCLEVTPDHFLALNARGVVKWLIFEEDSSKEEYELEAVDDLIKATKISPDFADAWANRGLIGLRAGSDLTQSVEKFDKALNIDSKYWLALNGKAVANGAGGKYWDFQKDIDILEKKAPNTPFIAFNSGRSTNHGKTSDGSRGATGIEHKFSFGFDLKLPGPLSMFGGFKMRYELTRGGIFMYLKEGQNLVVDDDDTPIPIGTWFALNYPPQHIEDVVSK